MDLRPRDLFDANFRRMVGQSLGVKPVVLVGPVGAGADDVAWSEIDGNRNSVLLQPRFDTSSNEMLVSLVAQIVQRIEPGAGGAGGMDGPPTLRMSMGLARRYGPDASTALEVAQGSVPAGWTLDRAMGLNAALESLPPLRIAITNLHRVPRPLVWELRDLVNDGRVFLIATTHRDHLAAEFGEDSPLFGNANIIDLPELDARTWAKRLSPQLAPSELDFLLQATRSRAASTIEILSVLRPGHSIQSAWFNVLKSRRPEAENVLNLAGGIHSYAPRLLLAIARREAPYGAIAQAPSQRVARALAKLRDMDLIEQPAQRQWQIADPILQGALASRFRILTASGTPDPFRFSPDQLD